MSRLSRAMAAAGRGAEWLLPAGRRDWVAALWAEAHEVPPGLRRLAWRAGGVWVLAREALLPRRLGRAALFAVAASAAAWAAWPQPGVGRSLRVLCYAAILALLAAWTFLMVFSSLLPVKPAYQRIFCNDRCTGVPGRSSGGPTWQAEILIMLLILGYVGVTLFLTSRRPQVTRGTLAIGT